MAVHDLLAPVVAESVFGGAAAESVFGGAAAESVFGGAAAGRDLFLERRFGWRADPRDSGAGLTFEGHAAVFDAAYGVSDWDGEYDEIVEPGAFKKTLREQGHRVKLLLDHGQHPLLGRIPLGSIDLIREDILGLFVRAQLHDNWMVKPVADAVRSAAMSEMSIAFRPIKETWDQPAPGSGLRRVRRLHEVALREVSVVTWGASPSTTAAVRGLVDAMPVELRAELSAVLAASCVTCRADMVAGSTLSSAADGTDVGAADRFEPAVKATRHERRQWAALLRGVTREHENRAAA